MSEEIFDFEELSEEFFELEELFEELLFAVRLISAELVVSEEPCELDSSAAAMLFIPMPLAKTAVVVRVARARLIVMRDKTEAFLN